MLIKKNKRLYLSVAAFLCTAFLAVPSVASAASSNVPATLMVPASNIDEVVQMKPPQTGDDFSVFPWLIVCAVAILICFIIFMAKRKKK